MKLKDLHSSLIIIFRPEELPFGALSQDLSADRLGTRYGLTQEKPPFIVPGIQQNLMYMNGRFEANGQQHAIDKLVVEPRRILLTVNSTTQVALALFEDIRQFLHEVELRETDFEYSPVSLTYETQSTIKFDMTFAEFLSCHQLDNTKDLLSERLPNYGASLDVYPISVKFRIGYRNPPETLQRSRISLVDKVVTIEIKEKTEPSECLFFAVTPSDSDTHLAFLREIEKAASK